MNYFYHLSLSPYRRKVSLGLRAACLGVSIWNGLVISFSTAKKLYSLSQWVPIKMLVPQEVTSNNEQGIWVIHSHYLIKNIPITTTSTVFTDWQKQQINPYISGSSLQLVQSNPSLIDLSSLLCTELTLFTVTVCFTVRSSLRTTSSHPEFTNWIGIPPQIPVL